MTLVRNSGGQCLSASHRTAYSRFRRSAGMHWVLNHSPSLFDAPGTEALHFRI